MNFPLIIVTRTYRIDNNHFLFYNSRENKKIVVNKRAKDILTCCDGITSLSSIAKKFLVSNIKLKKFFEIAEKKKLIKFIDQPSKKPKKLVQINSLPLEKIIWNITKKCNLKCLHCYANANRKNSGTRGTLTIKDIKKTIDKLNNKVLRITLTGGEPFLHKNILEVIKYLRSKDICVDILTNGTLITKSIAKQLSKLGVYNIRVSLHGASSKTNDDFVGVNGAFNKILKGIKYLVKENVPVRVTTNITPDNIKEIENFPKLLLKLGVKKWSVSTFLPLGKAISLPHSCLDKKFLLDYIKKIIWLSKKYKNLEIYYGFSRTHLNQLIKSEKNLKFLRRPCFCRPLHMLINSNGDVHPCVWLEEIILGNIKQENIIKIMNGKRMEKFKKELIPKNLKDCYKCKFFKLCGGGCRKVAKIYHEDLKAKDDTACIFFELFFPLILKELNQKEKKFLLSYLQ